MAVSLEVAVVAMTNLRGGKVRAKIETSNSHTDWNIAPKTVSLTEDKNEYTKHDDFFLFHIIKMNIVPAEDIKTNVTD